jgi:hypothetical protein
MASDKPPSPVQGPLNKAVGVEGPQEGPVYLKHRGSSSLNAEANPLIVLRRLTINPPEGAKWKAHDPLLRWATKAHLGQNTAFLHQTHQRRAAFVRRWCSPRSRAKRPPTPPRHARWLKLTLEWRLATGLGIASGILDTGIALHGTYGWPILPASSLKGLAAAGAWVIGR